MGVSADLCTFAKAVANGYPISVLAGREEIMRKIGRGVAHGGTYTAHPVSLAAADKTLEILDETDALEHIARYGTQLRNGMSSILKMRGIAHSFVIGIGRAAITPSTTRPPGCCMMSGFCASRTRASLGSCRRRMMSRV